MAQSVAAVLLVLALLGGLLAWLRRLSPAQAHGRCLRLLDAVELGNGSRLSIVRAGNRCFLLGATPQSISQIAELAAEDLPEEARAPAPAERWSIPRWVNGARDAQEPNQESGGRR